jgi:hypothetical protein
MVLGWSFLTTYPLSYLSQSFELGRVFMYKWAVDWKFLDEEVRCLGSSTVLYYSGPIYNGSNVLEYSAFGSCTRHAVHQYHHVHLYS